jgi:hypothetical protein
MLSTQQHHTLLTAQHFGGDFMRKLAAAGLAADPLNREIIFTHFPELPQAYGPGSAFYTEELG